MHHTEDFIKQHNLDVDAEEIRSIIHHNLAGHCSSPWIAENDLAKMEEKDIIMALNYMGVNTSGLGS